MSGKRILIVEDHTNSANALKEKIERCGGVAEIAGSYAEALGMLKAVGEDDSLKYNLILSDLGLIDSDALGTLDWLKRLQDRGHMVCALGVSDPKIVERAAREHICLILKGTSAEGIMESVFYALMRADPAYSQTASKEIVENRRVLREIPIHVGAWFFATWPRWVQVAASISTIATALTLTGALGGTVFNAISGRVEAATVLATHATEVDQQISQLHETIRTNGKELSAGHDERIKIFERLDAITKQLDHIDKKLDSR